MHSHVHGLIATPGGSAPDGSQVCPIVGTYERLRAGAELLAADRLVDAFKVFADILRIEPTCVGALVGAAHCALAVDDTQAARELLNRLLAVEPAHAGAQGALRELDAVAGSGA